MFLSSTRRTITIAALAVGFAATGAATSHAATWQFADGFEGTPSSTWRMATWGTGAAGFDLGAGTARSGANNARLTVQGGVDAARLLRPVHLAPVASRNAKCQAHAYVNAAAAAHRSLQVVGTQQTSSATNLLAWKNVQLAPGPYQRISTQVWVAKTADVHLLLTIHAVDGSVGHLRVDDTSIVCNQ